ncbi:hypothetical protein VNO78_20605 [Psophocarpus tetragonolobus]|uniref:Glycoside hydrolase family 19 catalytic domain-containing protein n=1 Tax=Psophocarpus tetragonolobus TaxID=3891 RepID=A0AAN9SAK9_PSOTE
MTLSFPSTFLFCFAVVLLGAEGRRSPRVSSLISKELFDSIFLHKDKPKTSTATTLSSWPLIGSLDSALLVEEVTPQSDYCDSTNTQWPCYPGKTYKGRGPIQLSWNYNYGPAGKALGFDGLRNPNVVSNNSLIAFKTALCVPTEADVAANRTAGFGLVTNIINGGLECGIPDDSRVNDRIEYFKRYTNLFNVDTGPNLDCA